MKPEEFIILFGSRNPRPIDKGDVIIARIALWAVGFILFLILGFALLDDYNDSDIVSAQDREQVETFLNSAHIMVMEGMLCRVFGVEYSGETCG